MTPAQNHAQKRAEATQLIRQHAPARLQDALIALLRPAIALSATRADDAQIPLGTSKFGGAPDVPPNFEWPNWNDKPLGFLAQINLEEVVAFDVEQLLPKSGLLSFFYLIDESLPILGEPEHFDGWKVYFWPRSDLSRRALPPDSTDGQDMQIMGIRAQTRWTLPNWDREVRVPKEFEYDWEQPCHQMLNWPRAIQDSPGLGAEMNSRGLRYWSGLSGEISAVHAKWILLLQLDTDGWFGDECPGLGALYFMIRREDLAQRDFSKVWLDQQCD